MCIWPIYLLLFFILLGGGIYYCWSVPEMSSLYIQCSTNMDKEKVDIALEGAKKANIRNIVALRGGI